MSGTLYKVMYLLHIAAVIVGFGSAVVTSFLSARARSLAAGPRQALTHAAVQVGAALTSGPIIAVGVLGLLLVVLSDKVYTFSQAWVSIAFLLFFILLGVLFLLVTPNAKAMDALAARLTDGSATTGADGRPRELAELDERDKKASAFSGIVHLLWLLLLIDMVWKPGF